MTSINNLDTVVCRPALPKDTDEVMELCSHIWDGGDYIPHVWDEWLADPGGLLGVAELGGHVVGVFKLTKFQENEWYLEGLRVHPDYQGKGIAKHIHEFVVETWRRMGSGKIRLTTHSANVKVHRMCDESGFKRVAEFIPYRASALHEDRGDFVGLKVDEASSVLDFITNSPTHVLAYELINLGWVFADTQLKHIQEAIGYMHAWWWRQRRGFISIWEDDEDDERSPGIQLLGCKLSDLQDMLMGYRHLMGDIGYQTAGWVAPNQPQVISSLEKTGFQKSWDASLFVYELGYKDR